MTSKRTDIRRAIPMNLPLSPSTNREKSIYDAMDTSGVEALKIARYFLQSGLGKLEDRRDVVNAKAVGATRVSKQYQY